MKTTGKRIAHLMENVLRMNREEFCRLAGVSRTSVIAIENDNGGKRALEDIVTKFQLNPEWVYSGKGSMWISGTDHENVTRIKASVSTQAPSANILESEIYRQQEERIKLLTETNMKMQNWLDRLINGNANFRKALGNTTARMTA